METKVLQVPEGRELASQLGRLGTRQKRTERGSQADQMSHTSIDDVALPVVVDGKVQALWGKQIDGTTAMKYTNTTPPTVVPTAPILTPRQISFLYEYDGQIVGNLAKPENVTALDVHVSTVQGFEPVGATRVRRHSLDGDDDSISDTYNVGSMAPHYVKFVFVTNSGAKGLTSAEVAVTPLGASDLAIAQLTTAIVNLLGTIHAENDAGDTLDFSAGGIHGFLFDGTPWIAFDLATATGFFSGEYATALTGARWVDNPGGNRPDVRRVYPGTGANFAEIQGVEVSGQAGMLMQANPGTRPDGMSGQVVALPSLARLGFANYESDSFSSEFRTFESYASGTAPVLDFLADQRVSTNGNGVHRVVIGHLDNQGDLLPNTLVQFLEIGADRTLRMSVESKDIGMVFGTAEIHIRNATPGETYRSLRASAFNVSSSIEGKTNIEPLPLYALDAILAAPVRQYERLDEIEDPRIPGPKLHIGAMAEDLPPEVLAPSHDEHSKGLAVDTFQLTNLALAGIQDQQTLIVILVQRCDDQADEITTLKAENAALRARLDGIEQRLAALEGAS